jgi:carbon monoxide dehydrogenase subunit G
VTRFTAGTEASAVITASREEVWALLEDPDAIAEMTPFVERITADGDHWTWSLSGLDVLGVSVAPTFTERMHFEEPSRIEFRHDPPEGAHERSAVEGWYDLAEHEQGTHLRTSLDITLDLPLPKLSSRAVTATMRGVVAKMGDRFSENLLQRLHAREV